MIKVYYMDAYGKQHSILAESGESLMEIARASAISGILAECGGACACATCHVYIDTPWLKKLPKMDEIEDTMLDTAISRQSNSRLSCQVMLSEDLDGISVSVAENFS